jgi:hypothetical protein
MNDQPKSKIEVDEDWKARVDAEKQAFSMQEEAEAKTRERPPLPAASLTSLISSFATQALVGVGRLPDPASGKPQLDLELARFAIDMIEVVQTKTAGNLEPGEEQMLAGTLHDLRMAYLDAAKRGAAGSQPGGDDGVAKEKEEKQGTPRIITP